MAYPHQLERFVAGYLTHRNAEVAQPAYGILEAALDEQLSEQLESDYIKLAFDYEAAQENPDAQYVTYSSRFLESLVGLAVKNHVSILRYCPGKQTPPATLQERAADYLGTGARNVSLLRAPKAYFAPCLRFKFKLAYLCDERQEDLHNIWMDGHSGKSLLQYGSVVHIFSAEVADTVRPELPSKPLAALLPPALHTLDAASGQRRLQLASQAAHEHTADLERTDAYFASMIEDLQFKLSKAKFAKDAAQENQITAKLQTVLLQKQHHIRDINDKYRVRCEVSLLDAALYMVPRWRVAVQATAGRGRCDPAELLLWWDEILHCFLP